MTKAAKHGVLMSKLEEYATLSAPNDTINLYFVLPDARFPDFVDAQPFLAKGGTIQERFTDNQKAVKRRIQQFAVAIDLGGPQ